MSYVQKSYLGSWQLFGALFSSSFLLFVGLLTISLTFWPALITLLSARIVYQPQLPLAADREGGFYNVTHERVLARQPFPPQQDDALPAAAGNWILIPSIGVAVPLVQSPTLEDKDVLATLGRGAALYPNGVRPGGLGTTFISAHSTGEPWKGRYRFAFLRINELSAGNLIHLDWEGTRYTYRVTDQNIVTPDPDFRVFSDRPVPTVAVMACWPLWSTSQRLLVHGELTHITKLTKTPS
jgi:LPXTG-site transpeptidase (sortase) family protein